MKILQWICIVICGLVTIFGCERENSRVLIYFNKNIEKEAKNGIQTLTSFLSQNQLDVDTTSNTAYLEEDSLKKFKLVLFYEPPSQTIS